MVITILVAIIIIQVYILYNLHRKIKAYNKECDRLYVNSGSFYTVVLAILVNTIEQLRSVDLRGSFEADDEVGTTFRTIVELVEQTKHQIENIELEE